MIVHPLRTSFGWDGDGGIGEMLIQQIIMGQKTATCSFKDEYTRQELQELLATKGQIVTVEDNQGEPRCNIRIIEVFETTFGKPDPRLVRGEGDGVDVKKFQEDHRHAWHATMGNKPLTDDTRLMVELFELVDDKKQLQTCE